MQNTIYDVLIIGGGLAGLTAAIALSKKNVNVILIEKQAYPHHKVCGEYVSNEILSYLNSLEIFPEKLGAKTIQKLTISQKNGKTIQTNLPLGGFGISRYTLDFALYIEAKKRLPIIKNTVVEVVYKNDVFTVITQDKKHFSATYVIGSYGKRSNLDKTLQRTFIDKKSPWLGIKAHYTYEFEEDVVALHNFDGGYCGLSKIENNAVNACYLTTYQSFKKIGDITKFQETVMSENPHLQHFFKNAVMIFDKPLSISQISFQEKKAIHNHIFMLGDSAGLIHPLCGNGMAMAVHSAKLFCDIYLSNSANLNREVLEKKYLTSWKKTFSRRLQYGRYMQKVLLHPVLSGGAYAIARHIPAILPYIVKQTHGEIV